MHDPKIPLSQKDAPVCYLPGVVKKCAVEFWRNGVDEGLKATSWKDYEASGKKHM